MDDDDDDDDDSVVLASPGDLDAWLEAEAPQGRPVNSTAVIVSRLACMNGLDPFVNVRPRPDEELPPPPADLKEWWQTCAKCRDYGNVLWCDTCSRVYHLGCHVPAIVEPPSSEVRDGPA